MITQERALVRFKVNQIGLAIDYWKDDDWRMLELIRWQSINGAGGLILSSVTLSGATAI